MEPLWVRDFTLEMEKNNKILQNPNKKNYL